MLCQAQKRSAAMDSEDPVWTARRVSQFPRKSKALTLKDRRDVIRAAMEILTPAQVAERLLPRNDPVGSARGYESWALICPLLRFTA